MKTEEEKTAEEPMGQDLSFVSPSTSSETKKISTPSKVPLSHQYQHYQEHLRRINNRKEENRLRFDAITKISELRKEPLSTERGTELIKQQISEWISRRKEKKQQEQKKFDFAEKILRSEEIPVGSCLKYISKREEFSARSHLNEENAEKNIITIRLQNGAYLSTEKPEVNDSDDALPPLGVITPTGQILYYHAHDTDREENDISLEIRPSEQYYKFNITSEPFEVYAYRTTQQPHYFDLNKINLLTNRQGEKYIRKRTEISTRDLKENEEDFAKLARLFDEYQNQYQNRKPNSRHHDEIQFLKDEIQFLKNELEELTQEHEELALKRDQAFAALERTGAIYADIFEPYCEKLVLIPRNLMRKEDSALYVDQIQPYKGESLDYLLSSNNKKPLTETQKLNIAKQCIALICGLYDRSLSNQHRNYSHGRLDLSHFCVLFEENQTGEPTPKVSLIGYKETPINEKPVKSYSGYRAPEQIYYERRKIKQSGPYRIDVYGLGVVLNGFENGIVIPEPKPREKRRHLDERALLRDVNVGVLRGIDTSHLSALQKSEYDMIVSLAERMKNLSPEHRPDINELKVACGLKTPFFPALAVIRQEIANEKSPEKIARLEQIAEEIVRIIRAVKAYEEHHKQKKTSSYLNRIEGYLSLLGLHRKNVYETHSEALLNATEFSMLSQRLNEFNTFIEESLKNESTHRPSFIPIFLNTLNEKKDSKTEGIKEFKELVERIAGKSSDNSAENSIEPTLSSSLKKESLTKKSSWSRSTKSSRIVPFN